MTRNQDRQQADQNGLASEDVAKDRLDRLVRHTRLLMAIERLAPPLFNMGAAFAGFYGLAWLGLFALLPPAQAWLPLVGLAVICAWALWPLRLWRLPEKQEVLARLDASSGLPNRPLSSFDDRMAATGNGPDTGRLWQIHLQRLTAQIKLVGRPRLALDQSSSDPYALRHLGILLLVMGVFAGDRTQDWSLMAALSASQSSEGITTLREDGWIDPPVYTQVPPIMLDLHHAPHHSVLNVKAPVGSKLVVRRSDAGLVKADWQGGLSPENDQKELRFALNADAQLILHLQGQRDVTVIIAAIPDHPPTVALTEPPKPDRKEGLGLHYHWEDDYGVVSGALEIVGALKADQSLETHPPLLPPPHYPLSVSPDPRKGEGKMRLPLEEQVWGGIEVEARLRVRDDLGQTGDSEPVRLTLPQRNFSKPLARALVEQRRALIVNPSNALKIREAVLALMIAPELFTPRLSIYLGLQRIERGLAHKKQTADQYIAQLIETADLMWAMALAIEDDGLSKAQQALQAAQNALKEAMERGASPEELKQLTDDLRRAMDQAMREMAENMLNDRQSDNGRPFDPRTMQRITPNDLKNLTDRMEEAMRRGDMAEAQRLLEKLKNITRNMQAARPRSQQQSEMDKALDDLDQMAREQQDLRDRTFREGQQGRNSSPNKNMQDLEKNQQALREKLEQLRRSMRQRGADQKEFGEAEDAMRDAEGALGQGQDGEAVDAQGRALEAMRKGGESLSQQMQQNGEGMGMGDGSGDPNQMADGPDQGRTGDQQADGQGGGDRDPLGRSRPSQESQDRAKLNDDGSRTAAEERARNLIEELRRRLGEVARPQAEIDYLQRLLKDNGLR